MTPVKDAQPAIMFEEFDKVPPLVRAHPDFVEAMKKRGITNINDVQVDPWAPGLLDPKTEPRTTRWLRALAYLKGKQNNGYARPIEGVVALVNLTEMKVERIIDLGVDAASAADRRSRREGDRSAAPGAEAAAARAAAGPQLHGERPRSALAEVALPVRRPSARRPRALHGRL